MDGSKSKKVFFLLVAVSVLSALLIVAVLFLGNNNLKSQSQKNSDLMAERDVIRERINRLNEIAVQSNKADETEKTVNSILPPSKKQQTLIAEIIYRASEQAKIKPSNISSFGFEGSGSSAALGELSGTAPVKSMSGVYSYPFTMRVESISYKQLINLLDAIEKNQRLIQVSNISINAAGGDSLSVSLSMEAYLQP